MDPATMDPSAIEAQTPAPAPERRDPSFMWILFGCYALTIVNPVTAVYFDLSLESARGLHYISLPFLRLHLAALAVLVFVSIFKLRWGCSITQPLAIYMSSVSGMYGIYFLLRTISYFHSHKVPTSDHEFNPMALIYMFFVNLAALAWVLTVQSQSKIESYFSDPAAPPGYHTLNSADTTEAGKVQMAHTMINREISHNCFVQAS
ncbi:uncharacterized protein BJ171DRAFT_492346 [Polychytrium aggregatum]|uniref:uncharacterized protein n=1 Tax=Polychytrium aggregatum TaxID=110093 RepID=UPI0022FDD5DE|nr:uncharacterized protein BJ171DRAFT_492346 [Polychytrium aggregatum]KAI9208007.1 hypothetical protein BJ171DRAFT_492346 [Polychytrium aggregatum]